MRARESSGSKGCSGEKQRKVTSCSPLDTRGGSERSECDAETLSQSSVPAKACHAWPRQTVAKFRTGQRAKLRGPDRLAALFLSTAALYKSMG